MLILVNSCMCTPTMVAMDKLTNECGQTWTAVAILSYVNQGEDTDTVRHSKTPLICRYESDMTERLHFHTLKKEMATHSRVLALRIPGMGEPGGLPSMGSHRVRHDWSDLAAAAAAGEGEIYPVFLPACLFGLGHLIPHSPALWLRNLV